MTYNNSDVEIFFQSLLRDIDDINRFELRDVNDAKIKAILNSVIYTRASRFLEGSIKNIVYNCCVVRGDSISQLDALSSELKMFNNPKFEKIKILIQTHLNFDIDNGLRTGIISGTDKSFLDEIVNNRHLNVHASEDSSTWYNTNRRDLNQFLIHLEGLKKILIYIDSIHYDSASGTFIT